MAGRLIMAGDLDLALAFLQRHEPGMTYKNISDETPGIMHTCRRVWDPINARLDPCSVPYFAALSSLLAGSILLCYCVQPFIRRRPQWTKNFVNEKAERGADLISNLKGEPPRMAITLIVTSLLGLSLQLLAAGYPSFHIPAIWPAVSLAVAVFLLAMIRPRTVPIPLLPLYIGTVFSQMVLQLEHPIQIRFQYLPQVLSTCLSLGCICVMLFMPFRSPSFRTDEISAITVPPSSDLRSPEDNLTLGQFLSASWVSPLMALANKQQLNDKDVWSLAYEFQHKLLHEKFRKLRGSVLGRLLNANGLDLIITGCLAIVELTAKLSTPLFLQQLLASMERSSKPGNAVVTYAVLSLAARLISAQSSVLSLWFSRRCYERSRGEMICMLYEKTLNRKLIAAPTNSKDKGLNRDADNAPVTKPDAEAGVLLSSMKRLRRMLKTVADRMVGHAERTSPDVKEPASMGKILNLMRNDVYEVAQRFWEFQTLITIPLQLIFTTVLLWQLLGWACLLGIVTVISAQLLNALLAQQLLRWEKIRRKATDKKLQSITQFVEAVRHLRWYAWQDAWLRQIFDARQRELTLRIITNLWTAAIVFLNTLANGLFPVTAFFAYTTLAGKPLRIDIAFPALAYFNMLESSLRGLPDLITVFLNARVAMSRIEDFMAEADKAAIVGVPSHSSNMGFRNASFAWPGTRDAVLKNVTLDFPEGLTLVCGQVAAGKTALLQALLGELDVLTGDLVRPKQTIGYCSQTPWLQSMSIRENILFSSPFEEARYKEVMNICALDPDMANFKHGDMTNIGENGIGLSGGQRARIALARAVYSRAKILFLDDPLSALDHQTAESIVRKCFAGQLLKGRTVVLVTHRTELCRGLAQQIVYIADGKVEVVDDEPAEEYESSQDLKAIKSYESAQEQPAEEVEVERFMEDEHREHGEVPLKVYWEYIKAGKLRFWFLLTVVLVLYRAFTLGETWYLKAWGEGYNQAPEEDAKGLFSRLPSPETNVRPWLIGYLLIAVAKAVIQLIVQFVMMAIVYTAGRRMFKQVMRRVSFATFRFYDVTPIGRLMNRMTSDIGTIDGNISNLFQEMVWVVIGWTSALAVIAFSTPVFLVVSVALTVAFVLIFRWFLPPVQSLRRLEMVSLSPLMSNFGELLHGLTTVRAFGAQHRFQARLIVVTDAFQKMDHFYWSVHQWLMWRTDSLSAFSTFIMTLVALYTGLSAGFTAFILIAANRFVSATHNACRTYGRLQMQFVSVERVVELLHVEQEEPGKVSPPAWWPLTTGDIVFKDVSIRYAPHLDQSLSGISFTIKGGSSTAVIGRTGSGKSTLALALLGTILPESGSISIDGVDIASVNKQALRSRVTFLAQDPVLFPGSMRENLDPLHEHSDDACVEVLARIAGRHGWILSTHIDTGGRNLSQGQRQLVGLARAVLRRSAIVIMDEATASIDHATAAEIQAILREELSASTLITIAHRVEAVRGADYCLELGNGRLVSHLPAGESLKRGVVESALEEPAADRDGSDGGDDGDGGVEAGENCGDGDDGGSHEGLPQPTESRWWPV